MQKPNTDRSTAREYHCTHQPASGSRSESTYYVIPRPITSNTPYRSDLSTLAIDWSRVQPYRRKKTV